MRCKTRTIVYLLFSLIPLNIHANKQTVMIPMRDGVRLATDIYEPSGRRGRLPCILMRTPYGKDGGMEDWMVVLIDLFQYIIAIQDMRGRHASEGADSVYFSDGWGNHRDGYDTVEWLAGRSWSNGKIGMFGASASGITQYLAAGAAPPHLTCCAAMVAASNLYEDAIFYGGEFRRSLVIGWLEEIKSAYLIPFFKDHHDDGPVYDPVNLTARFDSVNVPILHIGGWHDIFTQGVINAFVGVQETGGPKAKGNQRLIIGPWVHKIDTKTCGELTFPNSDAYILFLSEIFEWFDFWLKGKSMTKDIPNVEYYLMGDADQPSGPGNRWITAETWPPESKTIPLYLRHGGELAFRKPVAFELSDAFDFDPANPVPTLGGRNLESPAGSYDQRAVESRGDVLVYTTESLADSVVVAGPVLVRLWAGSDALDTDFTAKLCDVYPDGRSMLVADGIVQARHRNSLEHEELLTPGNVYEFTIDLWSTAILFAPGHKIRVSISSSNYPRFEINPNTGEPFGNSTHTVIAHQTIYHDTEHPSAIELPVLNDIHTGVLAERQSLPTGFSLGQNYPNPFNAETVIPLFISEEPNRNTEIHLEIVSALGRLVRHWRLAKGHQTIRWEGTDDYSRPLPSGIYVYRLRCGSSIEAKKLILLK
jgi:predicted acyl esterase